jgi:hypothetical protein
MSKFGKIYELRTSKGLCYLQHVNEYKEPPRYGDLVRILDGFYKITPDKSDLEKLVAKKEIYYTFIPLRASTNRKEIVLVGQVGVTDDFKELPVFKVDRGRNFATGKANSWGLWNKGTSSGIAGEEASGKYLDLPILGTENIASIKWSLENDWLPRYDGLIIGSEEYRKRFKQPAE